MIKYKEKTKTVNYLVLLNNNFSKAFASLGDARKYAKSLKVVAEVNKQSDVIKVIREVTLGLTVDIITIDTETILSGNDLSNVRL